VARLIGEMLSAELFGCAIDISEVSSGGAVPAYGWLHDDALRVVNAAERAHVAILGGDVWMLQGDRVTQSPRWDNWFVDRVDSEPTEDYVVRSAEKARQYISSYRALDPGDGKPVFEFVFGEKLLY
jgi:hypothetical protein